MLGRIGTPRKVGVCFVNQAVSWEVILCLLIKKGCGMAGGIIDCSNSLTLVGGETGHSFLLNLVLLPRKYMCQPHSCSQEESWAYSKNRVDQVVGDSYCGLLVLILPRSELCVEFHRK